MRSRVAFALALATSALAACSDGTLNPTTVVINGSHSPAAGGAPGSIVKPTGGTAGAAVKPGTPAQGTAGAQTTVPTTGTLTTVPSTPGATSGATTSLPTTSGSAGSATSGRTTTSPTSGSTTSTSSSCTDVQTADHQGEPCSIWVDWGHCDKDWLKGFCDKTCGRCTGSGTTTTSGRPAGTSGSTTPTSGSTTGGPTVTRLGNDAQQGYATRYWDCCKPHCAWPGNSPGGALKMCTQQNQSLGSADAKSSCDGGPAYTCWDQAPWAVSDTLAYGFAATPGNGSDCGKCYQLDFTGQSNSNPSDPGANAIGSKTMIVQATNKGYDVAGGQFDLLIPGGGVGAFNGCSTQWGVSNNDLGAQYGGFALTCSYGKECTRSKCNAVFGKSGMDALLKGCLFYVDWLQTADNPKVRYKQVPCPAALTSRSGITG